MSSGRARNARKRTALLAESSHPIPIGATVTVLSLPTGMPPRIEGRAVIKGIARGPHKYQVEFGDPVLRERVIHPDYQSNPEIYLQVLRDLWRGTNTPNVDEFFTTVAL
jgi:hypothetical protein